LTRLAVVIVNYRTPDLVVGALASLEAELDHERDLAVVVDNHSGDDSPDQIASAIESKGWRQWVQLIRSPRNGGFSAGNNLGIQGVDSDFYLLLNSDAYVRPGAIAELLEAANRHPEAGLISPRLEWPNGEPQISCFRCHSIASELISGAATSVVTKLLKRFDVPIPLFDEPSLPEWTSFACVLLRASVVKAVGEMDDGYFMYFDDVDYCRGAAAAGFSILHWPAARVVHLRGGTSPVKKAIAARKRPPAYFYASRSRYFAKRYGRAGLWLVNVSWLVGRAIAGLREVFGNKKPHICEGAVRDIWIGARYPLRPYSPQSESS
jgi:N-acetylglucosaminyl-diphospho-decaprenol L-rhamnosyltransferase